MNTKLILLLIISMIMIQCDNPPQQIDSCNCEKVFYEAIDKLEANYLVYKEMELSGQLSEYQQLREKYASIAKKTKASDCTEVINELLGYFDDGHLFVVEFPQYDSLDLIQYRNHIKKNTRKIDYIKKTLKNQTAHELNNKADQIVGNYTDGTSQIAIIKEKDNYNAYLISSEKEAQPGELKASISYKNGRYAGQYYSYAYQPRHVRGLLYKEGTLLSLGNALWVKTEAHGHDREISSFNLEYPQLPTVQKLDSNTVLFSIPTFSTDYQAFVEVIKHKLDILASAETLVIDIRGNTGGNAVYFSFLELYATKDSMTADKQGRVLASEDTQKYYEYMSQYSEEIYGGVVQRIKDSMGKIIPGPKYKGDVLEPYPSSIQHVAILTDGAVGSAAESFILHSKKASDKVTTFGSPTYGMIDYTSVNSLLLESSNEQKIYFGYPTSSLGPIDDARYPNGYNERGILPDVPIDPNVGDKMKYIIEYYKNQ